MQETTYDRPRGAGSVRGGEQVVDDLAGHAESSAPIADRRANVRTAAPRVQPRAERVRAVRLDPDRQRDRGVQRDPATMPGSGWTMPNPHSRPAPPSPTTPRRRRAGDQEQRPAPYRARHRPASSQLGHALSPRLVTDSRVLSQPGTEVGAPTMGRPRWRPRQDALSASPWRGRHAPAGSWSASRRRPPWRREGCRALRGRLSARSAARGRSAGLGHPQAPGAVPGDSDSLVHGTLLAVGCGTGKEVILYPRHTHERVQNTATNGHLRLTNEWLFSGHLPASTQVTQQ